VNLGDLLCLPKANPPSAKPVQYLFLNNSITKALSIDTTDVGFNYRFQLGFYAVLMLFLNENASTVF
jgi:hypothetical protein